MEVHRKQPDKELDMMPVELFIEKEPNDYSSLSAVANNFLIEVALQV